MRRASGFSALLVFFVAVAALGSFGQTDDPRLFALSMPSGHLRWSVELPSGARFVGNPTPGYGRIVVSTAGPDAFGGNQDRWQLTAYDAQTGRELWRYEPPASRADRIEAVRLGLTSPYLSHQRVYMRVETSDTSTLLALDAATGREVWTAERLAFGHGSRHTDIVTVNGLALAQMRDESGLTLRALQEQDGSERWRVSPGQADFPYDDLGPFLAANTTTFYVALSDGVLALDAASGEQRFRIAAPPGERSGDLAIDGGLLFWRATSQSIHAYDPTTGEQRWAYQQPFGETVGTLRSFDVRNGLLTAICVCDTDNDRRSGWLLGIDSVTGVERWRTPISAYLDLYQDIPAVGVGVVLLGSEDGDVTAFSTSDGSRIWRLPRERGQFVSADGPLIYATDRDVRWRHWLVRLGLPTE